MVPLVPLALLVPLVHVISGFLVPMVPLVLLFSLGSTGSLGVALVCWFMYVSIFFTTENRRLFRTHFSRLGVSVSASSIGAFELFVFF